MTKNTALKKTAPKYRTDYKPGARVIATAQGVERKGRVVKTYTVATGTFICVNIGDAKNPVEKNYRPAQVKGY